MNDDAGRGRELLLCERLHRRRRDIAVALDVVGEIGGVVEEVVVGVQPVGDAFESAEALQPLDNPRLDDVARALDLRRLRPGVTNLF